MNELLKEFIYYILEKDEGERKTREVGTTWQTDSGKWSAKSSERTQSGFASKAAADAWLSGTGRTPDKEGGDSTSSAETEPTGTPGTDTAKQPGGAPEEKPEIQPLTAADIKPAVGDDTSDSPASKIVSSVGETEKANADAVIASLDKKIKSLGKTSQAKKDTLVELRNVLESGDAAALQALITRIGLVVGKSGALKARNLPKQDITSKDIELGKQVVALAKEMGVEITVQTKVSSTAFTPQSIFPRQKKADGSEEIVDIEELPNGGVRFEGRELNPISKEDAVRRADRMMAYVREKGIRGRTLTDKESNELREYVLARVATHNNNITYLKKILAEADAVRKKRATDKKNKDKSDPLAARQFVGEEGKTQVVTGLAGVLDQYVSEDKLPAAKEHLTAMTNATNQREWVAAYTKFQESIAGTPVRENMKYIAETLSALRVLTLGGKDAVALIPDSTSFKLADVLAVSNDPFTGEQGIDQILLEYEEGGEVAVIGGVKFAPEEADAGNASVNASKIENSVFDTGTVDGTNCENVQTDLVDMTGVALKEGIFDPNSDDITKEAKTQLMGYINTYGNVIKAYYGLPNEMADAEVYEFLSYGKKLACIDGTPAPTAQGSGKDGAQPFKQAGLPNGQQWRAWSVLGMLTEAVHNRTVKQQFYSVQRWGANRIDISDGFRVMAKMEFQQVKKPTAVPGTPGHMKPDSAQNAFSSPKNSREQIRSGDPCEEAPKKKKGKGK